MQEQKAAVHAEHVALARVFSSVWLIGPPMSDELTELVSHLFSPGEARVAARLPFYLPRPVRTVARRARMPEDEVSRLLEAMADRRVVYRSGGRYCLLPLVPGMFEYLLMDGRDTPWHRRYARLINALFATGYIGGYTSRPIPAVRNIPVQAVVERKNRVVDADLMSRMIDAHEHMAVLNVCQCRQSARLEGRECRRATPEDGCLVFGSFARAVAKSGTGRMVSREEMRAIVERRWEQNLVFMAANLEPSSPNAVCTCCDCCCHYLESINRFNGRVSLARPHFLARVDESACVSCGACVRVCNTRAHEITGGLHAYDPERCIGCGLCVRACPVGAIDMEENPEHDPPSRSWRAIFLRILPAGLISAFRVMLARRTARSRKG